LEIIELWLAAMHRPSIAIIPKCALTRDSREIFWLKESCPQSGGLPELDAKSSLIQKRLTLFHYPVLTPFRFAETPVQL